MDDLEGIRGQSDQGERSDYFHAGNLDRIKDAPPNALAIVHWRDDDHERTGAPRISPHRHARRVLDDASRRVAPRCPMTQG
jgi:hypothetical protein